MAPSLYHVMSDIGSDSDATIADSVEEEDANSDNSTTSCSDDDSCDVGYADCIGSLQRGQKVLFDKLESVTPDATSLHYGKVSYMSCITHMNTLAT